MKAPQFRNRPLRSSIRRQARPQSSPRRQVMARPATDAWEPRVARDARRPVLRRLLGPAAVTVFVLAAGLVALFGLPPSTAQQSPGGRPSGSSGVGALPAPGASDAGGATEAPAGPTGTPVGAAGTPAASLPATPGITNTPSPTPAATSHPDPAPASAQEFALEGEVIEMGFPLKRGTRYRYRDNWGDLREGTAEQYNHAYDRRDGELRRAHDGIDIYANQGQPVLSPFDGVVIDPAARWQPWIPERYGLTVAIESADPTSEGYVALLSHLERLWVDPGQRVRRGEVLGTVGNSGNAEGVEPHIHFELRAPFTLVWDEAGESRPVDAFNPYPSLVAADPKRTD